MNRLRWAVLLACALSTIASADRLTLEEALAAVTAAHPDRRMAKVNWPSRVPTVTRWRAARISDRPPLEPTVASEALYETTRRLAADLGLELGGGRVGGASDGNFTAAAGIPTLDGLGPRGGGAHARDEHVLVADLPVRAALLAALASEP